MVLTDPEAITLLNTADFLNSKLSLGRDTSIESRILLNKNKISGKQVILQDIKDAVETYNREFIERPAGEDGARVPLHLARPARRGVFRPPGGGHVPRAHRRADRYADTFFKSAPSLHSITT